MKKNAIDKVQPPQVEKQANKKTQANKKENADSNADSNADKKIDKKIDSKILKLIWHLINPHKYKLILSIAILLISKGLLVFIPIGIKFGVDILIEKPIEVNLLGQEIYYSNTLSLYDIGSLLFAILLVQYVATYIQIYLTNKVGLEMMRELREQVFQHTINQSIKFYNKNRIGLLLTRIVHDIQTLNELFVTGIPTIFGDLFLVLSILVMSFFVDFKLALVSLVTLPFLYLGMMIFKRYSRKSFLAIRTKLANMNAFLQSAVSGIKIVQSFNRQGKMYRIFTRLQKDYFLEYLRTVKIYSYYFPVLDSFSVLSRVFIILFGSYWIYTGSSDIASLIAFFFFSQMFFHPLRELSDQYSVLQSALASGEKILGLLSTDEKIEEGNYNPGISNPNSDRDAKGGMQGQIAFENVHFSYDEETKVLKDINFQVNAGEKVALVGLTGSGKSTIVNLLSRMYDNFSGEIKIDGISIREYKKSALRNSIAYMLQDIYIFSQTVNENITLFNKEISEEQILKASKMVKADSFIEKLDKKYETELGEHGTGISYGETQLLAFCRVGLQNAKIIVLDEATSNIDYETEKLIQENISEVLKDKTAIVIAHRLSTIKRMDRIIVLHEGKVAEEGSHKQLIAANGLYKKLYLLQFQE